MNRNWSLERSTKGYLFIEEEIGGEKVTVLVFEPGFDEDTARLIASAPNLLKALTTMANTHGKLNASDAKGFVKIAQDAIVGIDNSYAKGGTVSRFKNWLNERIW